MLHELVIVKDDKRDECDSKHMNEIRAHDSIIIEAEDDACDECSIFVLGIIIGEKERGVRAKNEKEIPDEIRSEDRVFRNEIGGKCEESDSKVAVSKEERVFVRVKDICVKDIKWVREEGMSDPCDVIAHMLKVFLNFCVPVRDVVKVFERMNVIDGKR